MVWVTQVAETTAGNSYAGMPVQDRVVRWEQRGDRVMLRDVRYRIRAETDDPIAEAVQRSNLAPIIRVFDVAAYGKDKAPVIDVTSIYTSGVPEFSARNALNAGKEDSKRSFIEEAKSFPENVEVKVTMSYGPPPRTPNPNIPARFRNRAPTSSGLTAILRHSIVRLPARPMAPRVFDERVGFFRVGFTDFADNEQHEAERVAYITRWRLEKKDPKAEVSDPVKPIVFYVGRGTPEKWKPYVKAGVDMWAPAFEAAGFSNAIRGEYAPDPDDDPDWDPEDARISTIRWLPSAIPNAFGPHVHDPRTGEILEADVRMYHNVQKLVRDWYFVQASPNDKRAQELPMPDDLMGELIQFVVAHEVGHSLGFPHNMKASSHYSIEQLRDSKWTKENGTAPSIMDYARFNYVAQPGDNAGLMPNIGPYDFYAVNWGYRQFDARDDEKEELEKLIKLQVDDPMLRFGDPNPFVDSTQQTEDLGSDAVAATELGLKNLERVAEYLVDATSEEGRDYGLLQTMYGALLGQWAREMGHVVNVVGGVRQENLFYGDADQRFFPNDSGYQRDAVQFLLDNALRTPENFIDDDIVLRLTASGVSSQVLNNQRRILRALINERRINRMAEHSEGKRDAYPPADMMVDLRDGLFEEFGSSEPVDLYRRNLQRAYVEHLASFLAKPADGSDMPALARAELIAIDEMVDGRGGSDATRKAHVIDLKARIERALDDD